MNRADVLSRPWVPWLTLGLLCFLLFFIGLGNYPLFDVDEPRYAEAAREMLESQNWVTPYFNYVVRYDKPVFFYWLVAMAYTVFDVSEFAARFWSALSATLMTLGVFLFGKHWVSRRFGLMAALIFATSIEVVGVGRASITDMTLSFLMGATTLSLFMIPHQSRKWWLVAGFFSALACLTKGPVGIVLPGGVLFLYAWWTRQWKATFLTLWFLAGLAVWAVLTFPWYILAYQENGMAFLDALFLHNITRFSGTVSGHYQPWWFFYAVIAVGFLPWSIYLPAAVRWFWQAWREPDKMTTEHGTNLLEGQRLSIYAMAQYGLVWTLLTFVFFNVAQTKLLTYVLPLFPGLALWMAATWEVATRDPNHWTAKWLTRSTWGLLGVIVVVGVVGYINLGALLPREARHISNDPIVVVLAGLLAMGAATTLWFLKKGQPAKAILAQASALAILAAVAVHTLVPMVNQITQGSMLAFLEDVGNAPLATYEIQRPSLTYYAQRRIDHIARDEYDKLHQLVQNSQELFVITKNRYVYRFENGEAIQDSVDWEVVKETPIYSLIRLEKRLEKATGPQPS